MTAKVEWLEVAGDRQAWASLGLVVGSDGMIPMIGTCVRIVETSDQRGSNEAGSDRVSGAGVSDDRSDDAGPDGVGPDGASVEGASVEGASGDGVSGDGESQDGGFQDGESQDGVLGIVGWALSGVDAGLDGTTIDGLATSVVEPAGPVFAHHELGVSGLDHVVVLTHDLERTTDVIADATGCELKRIREVGTMRQGFHRIGRGGLIVEVVERPEADAGPAAFWGLVFNVDDIDAACERIGSDRIGVPKDAVQPGRRIATLKESAGLGLPVALMTT